MTPTQLLIGRIPVVFTSLLAGIWFATQWMAARLAYQAESGPPILLFRKMPLYRPWALFPWWYHFDACAPHVFDRAGEYCRREWLRRMWCRDLGSLWRARQRRHATTYGSARRASNLDAQSAGLFDDAGVFLGKLKSRYLRHNAFLNLSSMALEKMRVVGGGPPFCKLGR